jgi:cellulase/cellobiase CelA1
MPDLDHAPASWTSVANAFKSNSSVIFDLFNEPFPGFNGVSSTGWSCWKIGSTAASTSPCSDIPFAVAGMQTLVNTVRATGATNVLMLGGLAYSNDLSQWLQYEPTDPLNNLAASFHLYNFNSCNYANCWIENVQPVAAKVPVIAGEIGENDCASTFINTAMNWLDQNGIGYLAWAWNTYNCYNFPALISDYSGTPTAYGAGYKQHLYDLANGITPTPTPTPVPGHYCSVHYSGSSWAGGLTVNVTINNISSSPIVGWTLQFTFGGDQQVTAGWNATWSQSGQQVTARDVGYNDTIAAGSSASLGFNGTWTTSNPTPTAFTLNGVTCTTV